MQTPTDLNERVAAIVGDDMLSLVEQIRSSSIALSMARAQVEYLEEGRKALIAHLMEEQRRSCEESGEKVPAVQHLENGARSSARYLAHLKKQRDAKEELGVVEAEHFALRNRMDVLTEQLRFARAETRLTPA